MTRQRNSRPVSFQLVSAAAGVVALAMLVSAANGGDIFGHVGLFGGSRWDAAPRMIGVNERSLDGGLRYSLEGGSFQGYRDMFQWSPAVPSVADFQLAVEQSFAAWTSVDPVSGLGTALSYVADLGTPVVGTGMFGGVNVDGAEIDLLADDGGDAGTRGVTFFSAIGSNVTLTSGTPNYPGSFAISGADVTINSNAGAAYTLDVFRRLLTHELGHAIGLGDVENAAASAEFIDDNYDPTNSATALATLTNSWALLVNPLNPAASGGLSLFQVADADPGIDTPGVNILMESNGLGIAVGNPVTELVPLRNDDYGTRQFLYPELFPIVDFDIKPGSDPNSVNLKSRGVLPVAILTTDDFDALNVDVATILFGDPALLNNGAIGVAPLRSAQEDVDGDGDTDLTLKFSMRDLVDNGALGGMTIEGMLTGELFDATPFDFADSIRIVPPGDANNDLVVNAADYTLWANGFGTTDADLSDGDFTGDGSVDASDYTVLANNFGTGIDTSATSLDSNSNGNGFVHGGVWANNFGTDLSAPQNAIAAVPEPSTFALATFGLMGFVAYGWRRRGRA